MDIGTDLIYEVQLLTLVRRRFHAIIWTITCSRTIKPNSPEQQHSRQQKHKQRHSMNNWERERGVSTCDSLIYPCGVPATLSDARTAARAPAPSKREIPSSTQCIFRYDMDCQYIASIAACILSSEHFDVLH